MSDHNFLSKIPLSNSFSINSSNLEKIDNEKDKKDEKGKVISSFLYDSKYRSDIRDSLDNESLRTTNMDTTIPSNSSCHTRYVSNTHKFMEAFKKMEHLRNIKGISNIQIMNISMNCEYNSLVYVNSVLKEKGNSTQKAKSDSNVPNAQKDFNSSDNSSIKDLPEIKNIKKISKTSNNPEINEIVSLLKRMKNKSNKKLKINRILKILNENSFQFYISCAYFLIVLEANLKQTINPSMKDINLDNSIPNDFLEGIRKEYNRLLKNKLHSVNDLLQDFKLSFFQSIINFHFSRFKYQPKNAIIGHEQYLPFIEISKFFPVKFIIMDSINNTPILEFTNTFAQIEVSILIHKSQIDNNFYLYYFTYLPKKKKMEEIKIQNIVLPSKVENYFDFLQLNNSSQWKMFEDIINISYFNQPKTDFTKLLPDDCIQKIINKLFAILNLDQAFNSKKDKDFLMTVLSEIVYYVMQMSIGVFKVNFQSIKSCSQCNLTKVMSLSLPCNLKNINVCCKCQTKYLLGFANNWFNKKICSVCLNPNNDNHMETANFIYLLYSKFADLRIDNVPDEFHCCICNGDYPPLHENPNCINSFNKFHLTCLASEMKILKTMEGNFSSIRCPICDEPIHIQLQIKALNLFQKFSAI